ncbi:MAG: ATP-dependent Clp protease ATP-binding subunit, partial [Erysipelotrichaceae bacterium]|nr:ATP-dependent Clp protease ATP-binding subunit [Erysipelotrichaceae bacterium]
IVITRQAIEKAAALGLFGHSKAADYCSETLQEALEEILGQNEVLDQLISKLMRRKLNLGFEKRPLVVMMAGPSGVGKTRTAAIVAKEITDSDPIVLNMTEYYDSSSINRIMGSPAGYVGSDSRKELPFDSLESNPFKVILLDEFEKCHPQVQRLFMQVFEKGFITSSSHKVIDFSKSVIFITTNAGANKRQKTVFVSSQTEVSSRLAKEFDAALLNRIDLILDFKPISKDCYRSIVEEVYNRERFRLLGFKPNLHLPYPIPRKDLDEMTEKTYDPLFNARPAKRTVKDYIENIAFRQIQTG